MNQYEAMFIFDPTFAAKYSNVDAELNRIMQRASATEVVARKWDDRRLAYRIKGRKRGVYVLAHFRAPGESIAGMERDARLSENILRLLVLRADYLTEEDFAQSRAAAEETARRVAEEEARMAEAGSRPDADDAEDREPVGADSGYGRDRG